MKVLFLHGLDSRPGGRKPLFLTGCGLQVVNPLLPRDDFPESVRIAGARLAEDAPDVVVGSSRGGAVAMALRPTAARLVGIHDLDCDGHMVETVVACTYDATNGARCTITPPAVLD